MSTPRPRTVVQQELDDARATLLRIESSIVSFSKDPEENSFELSRATAHKKTMLDKIAELEGELGA